jgi:hypothetical protein
MDKIQVQNGTNAEGLHDRKMMLLPAYSATNASWLSFRNLKLYIKPPVCQDSPKAF